MSSRATSRSQSAKSSAGGRGLYELNQLYRGLECDWVLPFPLPSICSGPRALITDGTKPNHIAHAPLGVSRAAAAPAHSSAAALYPMCLLSNCFAHPPPANQVESEESNTWSGWASSNRAVTPSNFTHQGKGASVVEIMQRRCSDQRRKTRQTAMSSPKHVSGGSLGGAGSQSSSSAEYYARQVHGNEGFPGQYSTDLNGKINVTSSSAHNLSSDPVQVQVRVPRPSTPGSDVLQAGEAFAHAAQHRWGRRSYTPPPTPIRSALSTPFATIPDFRRQTSPHRHLWTPGNAEEAYTRKRGWRNSNGVQENKVHRERPVRLLMGLKKGEGSIKDLLAEIVVDDGVIGALSRNLVQSRVVPLDLKEGDAKTIQMSGKSNAGEGPNEAKRAHQQAIRQQRRAESSNKRSPFAATHLDHFFVPCESPSPHSCEEHVLARPAQSDLMTSPTYLVQAGGHNRERELTGSVKTRPRTSTGAGSPELLQPRPDLRQHRVERGEVRRPLTSAGFYPGAALQGTDDVRPSTSDRRHQRPSTSPMGSPRRAHGERIVDDFFIPSRSPDKHLGTRSSRSGVRQQPRASSRLDPPTSRTQSSPNSQRGLHISSLKMPRATRSAVAPGGPQVRAQLLATSELSTASDRFTHKSHPNSGSLLHQPSLSPGPWKVTPQPSDLTPQPSFLRMG